MVALIDMSADLDIYLYNFTTQGIGWNIYHILSWLIDSLPVRKALRLISPKVHSSCGKMRVTM